MLTQSKHNSNEIKLTKHKEANFQTLGVKFDISDIPFDFVYMKLNYNPKNCSLINKLISCLITKYFSIRINLHNQ